MEENESRPEQAGEEKIIPLFAPSRDLELGAPLKWLRQGWQDLKSAPAQSLTYGLAFVIIGYVILLLAYTEGNYILLFTLVTGFVLLGPILAFGLYDVSCQIQKGKKPTLLHCYKESKRQLGNELLFATVLIIILLVWARAASMIHVFFPVDEDPGLVGWLTFLGIGSSVGAVFAALVFSVSAFSLPMMMDKNVDVITAALTSINAVLRNKAAMLLWGAIIVASILVGFFTLLLGLAVLLPLIGHATWHAYQDAIEDVDFEQPQDPEPAH